MQKQKSFTIIELLVVIAVIGLLSSIVLVNMDLPAQRQKTKIVKSLEFSSSIQNALGSEAVGIWSFDNNALDSSGYGNNGTIFGNAVFTTDTPQKVVGSSLGKYALSFDGVDDKVSALDTNVPSGQNPITYEAWVNIKAYNTVAYNVIVGRTYGDPHGLNITTAGKMEVRIFDTGETSTYYTSHLVISLNTWTHLALTYGSNTVKMYVNGALEDTFTTVTPRIRGAQLINIGSRTGSDSFNGLIDEVRIYNQALTIGKIQKHYAEGLEKHQDLAVVFK